MYCSNCGKNIGKDINFCKYCGYDLKNSQISEKFSDTNLEIDINNFDNYKNREVKIIANRLLSSNYENFIKQ